VSHAEDHEGTRRDFLYYATAGAGAVTTGAAVWPLVNQMNPSADVRALSTIRVDVSGVAEGTQLTVKWLGKPVFIRRRTAEEIEEARAVDLGDLIDGSARNANLDSGADAADENRAMDEGGEWLVMMASARTLDVCHLAMVRGTITDGSVRATDRTTTLRDASAKGLRRRTCPCRRRPSSTKPQSCWDKELTDGWYSARPLRTEICWRKMASFSPSDRRSSLRYHHDPHTQEPQLDVDLGHCPDLLPRSSDRYWHHSCDALHAACGPRIRFG
jgi:ubiquinol-cytochrome c reductase iron-sulfur subunit